MPALTRPKRRWRVLAIAMAACAVLLVAAWVISTRSYFDLIRPLPGGMTVVVSLDGGFLQASGGPTAGPLPGGFAQWLVAWEPPWHRPLWVSSSDGSRGMSLPLWIPSVASVLAALAFWRIDSIHRRRSRINLCPACTCDRAGLPDAAPCPECGALPAPAVAVSR